MEVGRHIFEELIDKMKEKRELLMTSLTAEDFKHLLSSSRLSIKKGCSDFPSDLKAVNGCCWAVFRSWNNLRAIYYRRMNDIPGSRGTAVNVQAMVFSI